MVAVQKNVEDETFEKGEFLYRVVVGAYNQKIKTLKKIEDTEPEVCADWLEEPCIPITNEMMVQMLYYIQRKLDEKD